LAISAGGVATTTTRDFAQPYGRGRIECTRAEALAVVAASDLAAIRRWALVLLVFQRGLCRRPGPRKRTDHMLIPPESR